MWRYLFVYETGSRTLEITVWSYIFSWLLQGFICATDVTSNREIRLLLYMKVYFFFLEQDVMFSVQVYSFLDSFYNFHNGEVTHGSTQISSLKNTSCIHNIIFILPRASLKIQKKAKVWLLPLPLFIHPFYLKPERRIKRLCVRWSLWQCAQICYDVMQ